MPIHSKKTWVIANGTCKIWNSHFKSVSSAIHCETKLKLPTGYDTKGHLKSVAIDFWILLRSRAIRSSSRSLQTPKFASSQFQTLWLINAKMITLPNGGNFCTKIILLQIEFNQYSTLCQRVKSANILRIWCCYTDGMMSCSHKKQQNEQCRKFYTGQRTDQMIIESCDEQVSDLKCSPWELTDPHEWLL